MWHRNFSGSMREANTSSKFWFRPGWSKGRNAEQTTVNFELFGGFGEPSGTWRTISARANGDCHRCRCGMCKVDGGAT